MIWDEFLRHFRFCDEEDSGLSDEEQERKGPKNRPKHTRKRIHQAKKNFLEKFKTASEYNVYERKLKAYRDWKNTIATEKKISREEERKEIAKEMKADNEPVAKIMKYTKLTEEEINQLCESGVKREL